MTRKTIMAIAILGACALGGSTTAAAETPIDIGGKTSLSATFSVATNKPDGFDESTTLILGGLGAYTTENARFEFGGGLTILGLFSDIVDAGVYQLTGQARVNSNLLGPEENVLLYAGAVVGVSFIEVDDFNDEVGVFGPKVGAEFYMSPRMAIQIEDTFLGDSEGGLTNNLTIGFKLLFN